MRKSIAPLLLVLALIGGWGAILSGCDTDSKDFVPNAYKSLSAAGTAYDGIMKAAAIAYQHGQLTEAQKDQIVKYGDAFQGAYNIAVAALAEYVALSQSNSSDGDKAVQALSDVAAQLATLQNYATPILNLTGSK